VYEALRYYCMMKRGLAGEFWRKVEVVGVMNTVAPVWKRER
jgi:hypothetical protein